MDVDDEIVISNGEDIRSWELAVNQYPLFQV